MKKIEFTKDWCIQAAEEEGASEVIAGVPKNICTRCKNEIHGDDRHVALPDGFKRKCWIVTNLLESN